jgi:glycerol-3-phosphate acyltransferase PlsY
MRWLALLAAAYLLGSVSFSYLIVRALKGQDVRRVGSGNAGATNVWRAAGAWPAAAALVLDVGKGAAAVGAARWLGAPAAVAAGAAVAVVVGHVFPLFFGFRGGKGVATATGALGALTPWAAVGAFAVFVAVVAASRYVSLGSIAAAAAFPPLAALVQWAGWAGERDRAELAAAAVVALLVVAKHAENWRRLRAGTEHRLGGPGAGRGSGE